MPSSAELAAWQKSHPFEMRPWDRPGVVSRSSIARPRFVAQRPEIQVMQGIFADVDQQIWMQVSCAM